MPHFLGKNFLCQSQLLFFYCKTEAVNTVFLQTNDYLRYSMRLGHIFTILIWTFYNPQTSDEQVTNTAEAENKSRNRSKWAPASLNLQKGERESRTKKRLFQDHTRSVRRKRGGLTGVYGGGCDHSILSASVEDAQCRCNTYAKHCCQIVENSAILLKSSGNNCS